MREIKFRGWHKEQKKMYSAEEMGQDQLTLMPDGRGFANIHSTSTKLSQIDNNQQMIPLQYTGLKDKNGIEIYEGDIVEWRNKHWYKVYFENGCYKADGYELESYAKEEIKIIGNIYENPELLEQK